MKSIQTTKKNYITHSQLYIKIVILLVTILAVVAGTVLANESIELLQSTATIEGTLLQVSTLPPAAASPYPDCYYTALLDIKRIVSGKSIPKQIILVLPGFFQRKYAPESGFKVGDRIRASVVPFAAMPDSVRQTQQADEIESDDVGFYFPTGISHVSEFQKAEINIAFAGKKDVGGEHIVFQPIDMGAQTARKLSMRRDLEQINKLLAEHGGDWDKWYDSLEDYRAQYAKHFKSMSQKWLGDSFFSAGKIPANNIYTPLFINSVIAFKNYLAKRNVDLILLRVPYKGEIVDDLFVSLQPDKVANPYELHMYKELLEADVEIITDIIPRAKESRLKYPLMYWYQDFNEDHPADGITWVVAEDLAERLSRYERIRNMPKRTFSLQQASQTRCNPEIRWPAGNSKFNPAEYVRYPSVRNADGSPLILTQGTESPVLMLGSSYIAQPDLEKGGSIPHYFAYLTGIAPDLMFRSGADRAMPRAIAREGDGFLKNRNVVLFPFTPYTPHTSLSSPPITDPAKMNKTVLATYTGNEMQKYIQLSPENAEHVFRYLNDGSLIIHPANHTVGEAGSFRLTLPKQISEFPFFIIEINFESNNGSPILTINYNGQKDSIFRSWSDPTLDDFVVFKSDKIYFSEFNVSNIEEGAPAIIKSIRILGLRK